MPNSLPGPALLHTLATALVATSAVYLAIGILLAPAMAFRGVSRIDPAAREGTRGFRFLIMPGMALLWPLMVVRILRGGPPPEEHNAHRDAARNGASS
jgi:hypothetical protein